MSLQAGTQLGKYEIVSPLGAGGMGEVYRARDTKLGRSVAIKVLPDAVAQDTDRIARFEREAKALAALNHPHIATLLGLDEVDGRHLLIMELVEGETLAERLARGALAIDETLRIARQIADALEAAHERGIVHRDLKPANVKLTPDDQVKVLDFGLAKAMDTAPEASGMTNSPTLSVMATAAGIILGTAGYMSPEQAKGQPADHRSDIFSFGCVLFEMLSRQQPFNGETVSDVMASVLAREPNYAVLPPDLNPRLIQLLKRCLEKPRKQRWQAIGDVRAELETIAAEPLAAPIAATLPARSPWRTAAPVALLTAVVVGSAAFLAAKWTQSSPPSPPLVTFAVRVPAATLSSPNRLSLAVAPDGSSMVFAVDRRFYIKNANEVGARVLGGSDGLLTVNSPVYSPDGRSVVFWANSDTTLKRLPVAGGTPFTLCTASQPYGVTWSGESIIFSTGTELLRVSANGGTPESIVKFKAGEMAYGPQVLPDGKTILVTMRRELPDWSDAAIVAYTLGSETSRVVLERANDARYTAAGYLLFARSGVVYAVRFDPNTLAIQGEAVPFIEGVRRATVGTTAAAHFALSDSTVVYIPGPTSGGLGGQVIGLFPHGVAEPTILNVPAGMYAEPRISGDGRLIVYAVIDLAETNLWVYDVLGKSAPRRLTFGGQNRYAAFSPDGKRIALQSNREGDAAIFVMPIDGLGVPQRLTKPGAGKSHVPQSWSPDGTLLLFDENESETHRLQLYSFRDNQVRPTDIASVVATNAMLSPDGRWLVYTRRNVGGRAAVFVQPFPLTGAQYQISRTTEDGHHPVWSPTGNDLFYTPGPGASIMRVSVTTKPTFSNGDPEMIARTFTNAPPTSERTYDISPSGQFVGLRPPQFEFATQGGQEAHVIVNWLPALKAKLP